MFRKKWLASILSVMMVFAFLPVMSFAEEVAPADENETPPAPIEESVDKAAPVQEEEVIEEAPATEKEVEGEEKVIVAAESGMTTQDVVITDGGKTFLHITSGIEDLNDDRGGSEYISVGGASFKRQNDGLYKNDKNIVKGLKMQDNVVYVNGVAVGELSFGRQPSDSNKSYQYHDGVYTSYTPLVKKYSVTYTYEGTVPTGAPDASQWNRTEQTAGTTITVPVPTLEDYEFSGWTSSQVTVSEGSFGMPEANVTLVGHWTKREVPPKTGLKITYAFDDTAPAGAALPNPSTISDLTEGTSQARAANPEFEGYTFNGWVADVTISVGEDGTFVMPGTDVNFIGSWTQNQPTPTPTQYTVKFDLQGHGDPIADQPVDEGEKAQRPADPSAEGYTFGGWFTDPECTNSYDFDSAVEGDITLYALWTPVEEPPVPPTPTPTPTPGPGNGGGGGGGAIVPAGGVPIAAAATPAAATQIQDQDAPKGLVDLGAWALLNLLLTILTCIMSVCLLITYFTRKKEDEEENAEYVEEQEEEKLKKKGLWRLISAAWGILMIIVFILTEDMTLPMVFVDKWTILMIVMTAIQGGIMIMSRKKYDEEDEDAQMA